MQSHEIAFKCIQSATAVKNYGQKNPIKKVHKLRLRQRRKNRDSAGVYYIVKGCQASTGTTGACCKTRDHCRVDTESLPMLAVSDDPAVGIHNIKLDKMTSVRLYCSNQNVFASLRHTVIGQLRTRVSLISSCKLFCEHTE